MSTTPSSPARQRAPLRRRAAALAAACALAAPAAFASDIVSHEIAGVEFEEVAFALVDAIATEGITPPTVSHFGDMLKRTAPDLGHSPTLYADARIYTFCSASAAARLVTESRRNIALCPLSIAVYQVEAEPPRVQIGYRRSAETAGGAAVDGLLERIVKRAVESVR